MSHKNLVSSRRSKAKSSALDHPLHDPQPLHTSRSPLQAPKTGLADAQIAQNGEARFRAPPPSFTSMPPSSSLRGRLARWVPRWRSPSPNRDRPTTYGPERSIADTSLQLSPDNLRPSLSLENRNNTPSRRDPHAIHEKSAVSPGRPGDTGGVGCSSSIESLPAPVASAEATDSYEDRKKTIMGAIKLLLQTSSTALKFAPIPNLDQIPTTLLTWIQAYESVASNVEDMEKLYVVIQQVRDSVLQPLREWTGEIPPELEHLTRDFHAALKKQVVEIRLVQHKNLLQRAIRASDITQQINYMKNSLNDFIYRSQLRISTLILLRTERLSVQSELSRLKPVAAEYMYVKSKSECLERTRVQMQASLLERLKASENRFTWLRGSPGTGKTAICMSVASTFNSQGTLAASFFWDKNQAGTGLDSIDHFPSTLAHQLAVFNEDFKMSLVRRLRQPYLGFVKSLPLDKQMDTLVIEPMCNVMGILPSGEGRFIIILDGLDECGNPEALKTLMRLVLKLHDLPSSFAVLVSSRPEMQVIRAWARVQSMGHVIPCEDIDMIDKSETFLTIRRMVVKGLEDCISESLWKPSGKDLDAFALACRELPVIASLRIREVCIRTERGATLKSEFNYFRNLMDAPTGLKSEYLRILRRAYTLDSLPARPSVIENYRLVMGTITAARKPLSVYSIGQLIGITEDEVHATLRPISSIVNLPSTQEGKPHFYHATVKEFNLGAPIDAGDHSFFISDRNGYFLGLPLLQFLRGIFERNELAMPTEGPLGDEEKWKDFQKKERPEHIRYAVKYLFSHLDPSKLFLQDSSELQREFDHLLTHNLLAFMVLSCGEFELPDELLRYNNHSSIELLRETKRVNKYILEYSFQLGRHSSVGNTSARDGSHSFDPWHIFRSVLPFSPPIFGFYHHLSDPVCIFSIYGEFTGHLIPLSEHALEARNVMETKLSRLPKRSGSTDHEAEFIDPGIRNGIVTSAAISKDGACVALGFGNGDIEVVDIDQQHAISRSQCDSHSPIVWIEFITGCHRIAAEDNEGNIFIFDPGSPFLKLGTLPSGWYPPVTMVADNGSFIIRLPRHLGANWYESVAILYVSGEPSNHLLSSPGSVPATVPDKPLTIPCGLTLELSPGARYVVACDSNHAFIWSTESREFIASHRLGLRFATFVTGATPYRPFIISGDILAWTDSIPHMQNSRVEGDLDSLWLESLSHRLSISLTRRLAYIREYRELLGAPNPKLWLNDTLKLILPIEYHPILFSMNPRDRRNEWYGDRVMGGKDFIYFPRASRDGTRFLIQGRTRASIVIDISQII